MRFEYREVDSAYRDRAAEHAQEIRNQLTSSSWAIVDIGSRLIEVRRHLGSTLFRQWISCEFEWSQPTASNYMRVAAKFGDLDCVDLQAGLNVMDLTEYSAELQALVIRSTIEWVNHKEEDVVSVIPEAWEFVPEGRGSSVKLSAEKLVRKGAGLRNFIWIDSQDLAGVAKVLLRAATVWILGVQREANELKRCLDSIPAGIKRPSKADVAQLERGQFYVCWKGHTVKTYVQPAWMTAGGRYQETHDARERIKIKKRKG